MLHICIDGRKDRDGECTIQCLEYRLNCMPMYVYLRYQRIPNHSTLIYIVVTIISSFVVVLSYHYHYYYDSNSSRLLLSLLLDFPFQKQLACSVTRPHKWATCYIFEIHILQLAVPSISHMHGYTR